MTRVKAAGPGHAPAPSAVTLRTGGHDDLDEVITVMNAAFDARFGERWTRSQCAGILPMSGVELRLAQDGNGAITGFTLSRHVADEAELLLLAVAPESQRHGIGGALLRDFVERATGAGAQHLHLEVRDGNPAMALYDSGGFSLAGRRVAYYHGPDGELHDALTLRREARNTI